MTVYKKIGLLLATAFFMKMTDAQVTVLSPANVSSITFSVPLSYGSAGDLINGSTSNLVYMYPPASDSVTLTFTLRQAAKLVSYDVYFYSGDYSSDSIGLAASNDSSNWTRLDVRAVNGAEILGNFSNTSSYTYYRYTFKGFGDKFGLLALSGVMAYDGTLNAAPVLSAATRSGSQVTLSWNSVIKGTGNYDLYKSSNGINFTLLHETDQSTLTYTDTLADTTIAYWYKVRASNAQYNSPFSNIVEVTDSLQAPVLNGAPGSVGTQANLSWSLVMSTAGQFALERSADGQHFTLLKTVDKSVTNYTDSTLSSGTSYWYRIKGINYLGSSPYSDTVKIVTVSDTLTHTPVLKGMAPTGTEAVLSWNFTFNTPAPGHFELQQSTDGINYSLFGKFDGSVNSYTVESLTPNTSYWYRIRAANYLSASPWSDTVKLTTNNITSMPADITDDGGQLYVSADNRGGPNASEGSSHLIDNNVYTKWLVFTTEAGGDLSAVYKPAGSYIVTSYALATANDAPTRDPRNWTFSGSNDSVNWVILDTRSNQWGGTTPRSTLFTYTLSNPGAVAYKFYRINFTANNGATDGVRFQMAEWQIFGVDNGAPELPASLQVTATTISTISLSWSEGVSKTVNKFRLQRSTDGLYFTTLADSLPASPLSYADTGLPDSTTYYYRIQAIGPRPTAVTGWSNVAVGTTSFTPGIPLMPGNLTASFTSDTVVGLQWIDRSYNETGFKLERSQDSITFTQIADLPANTTSYYDSTVSPGTVYYYRIRSYNGQGSSGYSNVLTLITTGGNTPPRTTVPIIYRKICGGRGDYPFSFSGLVPGGRNEGWQTMKVTAVTADSLAFFTGFTFSPDIVDGVVHYRFTTTGLATSGDSATILITVKDNGGTLNFGVDSAVFPVRIYFVPLTVAITADKPATETSRYQLITLTASSTAPDNTSYTWSGTTGIEGPADLLILRVRPIQTTTYTVTGTTPQGCSATAEITVTPPDSLVITNVLTPNGDGKNDTWVIWGIQNIPDNVVKVFDRRGRLVFMQKNYSNNWDGTYGGKPLEEGAYYYVVDLGNGSKPATGMLTIVRDHH
ncbi:MAG: gliding motility-associated C-terminal domain-containing protein [Chitinophagaceae bacterium]|nr:gliding motility-associated C-terminal domain-containing protein [Chitinophagaceae bacterium]